MSLKSIITLLFIFSAILSVQAVARINNPIGGTVWKIGSKAIVSWYVDGTTDANKVNLVLKAGDPNSLQFIALIAKDVPVAQGSLEYLVPGNLVTSDAYTVGVGSDDTDYNYSHYFRIEATPVNSGNNLVFSGFGSVVTGLLSVAALFFTFF
ncbi:6523_t:CDS:2 [Ambispora gerdemannii]|uniref:6523_t:CDS:1 n=1 Tax=Ambispora gerdemannii TaxID=144530 RepID=A0A9N9AUP1_9GLOM|nr:6523_t:CDS:2 [Ambispora gerdemannii]